ncbi:MAG: ATP-binding protein [Bacteroidota bacterium]
MPAASDNIFVLLSLSIGGAFLLIVSFIIIQVRNQNRLLRQKKKLDEAEIVHQKDLLHTVIRSQEEDRRRIGQNLHDDVGSDLAVLKMQISGNPGIAANMPLIERVIESVRTISHQLSPQMLTFLGLYEVLEDLCENLAAGGQIHATFECDEQLIRYAWPESVALALYRVIQELVANTLKHAQATRLEIGICLEGDIIVVNYRDNGKGLQPGPQKGMGMANIVSRLEMIGATWEQLEEPGYRMQIRILRPSSPITGEEEGKTLQINAR